MGVALAERGESRSNLIPAAKSNIQPTQTEWAARNIHWLDQSNSPGRRRGKRAADRGLDRLLTCMAFFVPGVMLETGIERT